MNTIDFFGKELVLKPVDKIRVRFRDGRWYVECRTKKWKFNVWSVEGNYNEFMDAKNRAEVLKSQGGFFVLRDMVLEYDVNSDNVHDITQEQPPSLL